MSAIHGDRFASQRGQSMFRYTPRPVRAAADAANPGGADCRGATLRRALGCGASLGLALLLVIAEPFLPATAVFGDPARPPLPSGVGPVPGPSPPKPRAAGGPGNL